MIKRLLLYFFAFTASAVSAGAAVNADTLYEKGLYKEASTAYETLVLDKKAGLSVFYNLGNAYYRQQMIGKAVLNYEKALLIRPRDKDTKFNLDFLRTMVKEPQPGFALLLIESLNGLLSLNTLTVFSSVSLFIFSGSLVMFMFRRESLFAILSAAFFILFIVFTGWFTIKMNSEVITRHAVVTTGPADIRNGPGQDNSVGFTLPEGRVLNILGRKEGWYAVGLPKEGLSGWIESSYIEEIKLP